MQQVFKIAVTVELKLLEMLQAALFFRTILSPLPTVIGW